MNTYSPISGMIICQNDTGDYVAKPDYDALIQTLAQERQGRETAEADAYRMVDRVLRGEHSENCPFCAKIKMDGTSQQVPMCRLCDVEATLDTERQRAEKAERELEEMTRRYNTLLTSTTEEGSIPWHSARYCKLLLLAAELERELARTKELLRDFTDGKTVYLQREMDTAHQACLRLRDTRNRLLKRVASLIVKYYGLCGTSSAQGDTIDELRSELAEARKDIADITEVWGHQITDYLEARHAARETGKNG